MQRDSKILMEAAEEYHLELNGIRFWTPYWINWASAPYFLNAPYQGKGTPGQIKAALRHRLIRVKSRSYSADDYRLLMRQSGLGIDCSGLAVHLMTILLRQVYKLSLGDHVFIPKADIIAAWDKPSWQRARVTKAQLEIMPQQVPVSQVAKLFHKNPRRLTNVDRLTSPQAANTITQAAEAQPGDLIKTTSPSGDHIGVIVLVEPTRLRYAESRDSDDGIGGVSFRTIRLLRPELGLEAQTWQDKVNFNPTVGDRICRLKVLA